MSRYAVLMGQLQRHLRELTQLVTNTQALMMKVQTTGDPDYLGTVALNLHSFYSGVERLLREVALVMDGSLPNGADWHRRLLQQMATEVPDLRPALLRETTLKSLHELCAFRHVVRHVYTFELIPERVIALAHDLPDCLAQVEADVAQFCQFLQRLNGL